MVTLHVIRWTLKTDNEFATIPYYTPESTISVLQAQGNCYRSEKRDTRGNFLDQLSTAIIQGQQNDSTKRYDAKSRCVLQVLLLTT